MAYLAPGHGVGRGRDEPAKQGRVVGQDIVPGEVRTG